MTQKNAPAVSVIIPTFNRALWLRAAVESVLNQSFRDFELIVIDDGSTDATAEVVSEFDEQIRYYFQTNQGPSAARNLGIHKAKAPYLCFLDSDDQWQKNKLAIQIDTLARQPEFKICYTGEIWIRRGVRVNAKKVHRKYSGRIYQHCLPLCLISPSSVMIHRDVLTEVGLFDTSFPVCEDYELWLRICQRYPVNFINQPLIIKYGGHEDQLSRRYWGMDRFRVRALEKILSSGELSPEDRRATINILHQKCDILVQGFLKRGKKDQARQYLLLKEKYRD
ncbi:MAG TPA: glycosyltransferase [bacterium]|nr:glycosyltransferase [bacterium]